MVFTAETLRKTEGKVKNPRALRWLSTRRGPAREIWHKNPEPLK
jgi:hypothetical protein